METARGSFEIPASELARLLESGAPIQVLDVRAPARVAAGHIETRAPVRFLNISGSMLTAARSLAETGIDRDLPVVAICGHGNDSRVVAAHLAHLGARATSLTGGMAAWMETLVPREIAPPPSLDRFVQLDRIGKGALGYVLTSDGTSLIVDPPRNVGAYLDVALAGGAKVIGVADTHIHADYISGAPALAASLGVPYYLHPLDHIDPYDGTPGRFAFHALEDKEPIRIGRATVHAWHTPGHTEGSTSFLIDDAIALTGDFVMVGSIGRPDLAGKEETWAKRLWTSVETVKRAWPASIAIRPAHYSGDGERLPDRSVGGVLRELIRTNEALRLGDRDAFMAWVLARRASFPESYRTIKAINLGLREVAEREAEELEVGRNECALGGRGPG